MGCDIVARERFCNEIGGNFSVIAPAGVGKTRAIIDRIVSIGRKNPSDLRHLVVVTYTKKAADEMSLRAFASFDKDDYVIKFLQKSFFGTIHSYCFSIIREYTDYGDFSVLDNDDGLRMDFLLSDYCKNYVDNIHYANVLKHIDIEDILSLCTQVGPKSYSADVNYPQLYFENLLNFENKRAATSISEQKVLLRNFIQLRADKNCFAPIPECKRGGSEFKEAWNESFAPLNEYLEAASYELACKMSNDYLRFRMDRKQFLYDDIIYIARNLLDCESCCELGKAPISILLDEAQDTDFAQFDFLLKLFSMNELSRFSMVGDPQQAIYGSRTHVADYVTIHKKLVEEKRLEELIFSQTFRCPISVVNIVNEEFSKILIANSQNTQVNFVPLSTPKTAKNGAVINLDVPASEKSYIEAEGEFLADYLESFVKKRMMLRSDICILSPRNSWLSELNSVFKKNAAQLQLHSNTKIFKNNRAFSILFSLITLINCPQNSYELSGLLIYLFGIKHYDLAKFVKNLPKNTSTYEVLRIDKLPNFSGDIANCLIQLHNLLKKFKSMPLTKAVINLLECINAKSLIEEDGDFKYNFFLNKILYMAALAESELNPISSFLKSLHDMSKMQVNDDVELNKDAYQAFSCHKAKGLEWPIVVIPFMSRKIEHNKQKYPYIYQNKVILNSSSANKPDLTNYKVHELKRMLYVSFTRAKDTLILVNNNNNINTNELSFSSILSDKGSGY